MAENTARKARKLLSRNPVRNVQLALSGPRAKPSSFTKFNPEGRGYDYRRAIKSRVRPTKNWHMPSRDHKTGQILKGRGHPTFHLTEKGEKKAGYEIYRNKGDKYYSRKKR